MVDPWMGIAQAGIMAAGSIFGSKPAAPAGPSRAENSGGNIVSSTPWNADGWIVTTGGGKADVNQSFGPKSANPSSSTPLTATPLTAYPDPVAAALGVPAVAAGTANTVLIGAVVVLGVLLLKRSR